VAAPSIAANMAVSPMLRTNTRSGFELAGDMGPLKVRNLGWLCARDREMSGIRSSPVHLGSRAPGGSSPAFLIAALPRRHIQPAKAPKWTRDRMPAKPANGDHIDSNGSGDVFDVGIWANGGNGLAEILAELERGEMTGS